MADKATNEAHETARQATPAAKGTADEGVGRVSETVEESGDAARRASETAARSYEELLTFGQDNMEGMARASQALLKGTSDLGSLWASFWNEQLTTSMEAMRSLAECHSWDESVDCAERIHQVEPRPGLLANAQERRVDLGDGHEQLRAPAEVGT